MTHPALIRSTVVPTEVHHYECRLNEMRAYACGNVMPTNYENGHLLVCDGVELPFDEREWELIRSVDLPPSKDNFLQKAREQDLMLPIVPAKFNKHLLNYFFPGDHFKAALFQATMAKTNAYLRGVVGDLFPEYKVVKDYITWRFTRTENENMHFDSYGGNDNDLHNLRLFINIDDKPRLWGVSYPVDDFIKMHASVVKGFKPAHPNTLNDALTHRTPLATAPRHFIAFPPGSAWLVNSQVVSHEIVFGRKVIACVFQVDPKTMLDPTKGFVPRVERALRGIHGG